MPKRGFSVRSNRTPPLPQTSAFSNQSSAVLTPSWKLALQAPRLFWCRLPLTMPVLMLPTLLYVLGSLLANDFTEYSDKLLAGLLVEFLAGLLLLANISVAPYVQVAVARGYNLGIAMAYRRGLRAWPRVAGFALLFSLMLVVAVLCFVVPAFIVIQRYLLTPFFIVEYRLGIREAMRRSAAVSRSAQYHIWSMITIIVTLSVVTFGLSRLVPPYGAVASGLLSAVFGLLPALRYADLDPVTSTSGVTPQK